MYRGTLIGLLVAFVALLIWRSTFVVGQTQAAVRTQFGQVIGTGYRPGLHLKSPLDEVHMFDRRLRTGSYPAESFVTKDQKSISIDFDVRWRIADALKYFEATGGDQSTAAARLAAIVRSGLKAAVAQEPLAALITSTGSPLQGKALRTAREAAATLGIGLAGVQIRRIRLGDDAANSIYQRMQQSLLTEAQQRRLLGADQAAKIRADAQRQRAKILADATLKADKLRAQADGKADAIYARSFGRAPDFAAYYLSLQAYRKTLGQPGDVLVLSPDGQFFKYLRAAGH